MDKEIIDGVINEKNIDSPIIKKMIKDLQESNYSKLYELHNFCDIKINGKWTVGFIKKINKNDYTIDVLDYLYSGEIRKYYIFDNNEITFYRNETSSNEIKRKCIRNTEKELNEIINYFSDFMKFNFGKNTNFPKFNNFTPYKYITFLRGQLFYITDEFFCYSKENNKVGIDLSLKFIEIILSIIKNFYNYAEENNSSVLFLQNLFSQKKYNYLLINNKFAIISFLIDSLFLLKRLFGLSNYYNEFYTQYENIIRSIIENPKDTLLTKKIFNICNPISYQKKTYLEVNNNYQVPSRIICYSIDYFFTIGGFDSITNLLCSNINFPFNYLIKLTEPFIYIKSIVGIFNDKLNQNILKIWDYFDNKINSLNDNELKNIQKDKIFILMKRLLDLCSLDNYEKQNKFENSYLNYLNKCFNSNILEFQIYAIDTYDSIVLTIKYNNEKNNTFQEDFILNKKDYFIQNLDELNFVKFLDDNKVINSILQDNTNEEIIKKSFNILLINYENNYGLNKENYGMIKTKSINIFQNLYKKLINTQEHNFQKMIINLFCKLAPFLNEDDKYFIFKNLKNFISFQEINQELISFIQKFTVQCLMKRKDLNNENNKKENEIININLIENVNDDNNKENDFIDEKKYYGLKILFNFIQSENENNFKDNKNEFSGIIDQSIQSIKTILYIQNLDDSIREEILKKSFDNIKNNKGSVQNLILIKEIIENNNNSLIQNFNSILEKLNKENNLFTLIINNLLNYYDLVSTIINNENLNDYEINEMKNTCYSGIFTHENTIKSYIDLLIVLMNKDRNLNWEFDIFLKLWNKTLKDKLSQKIIYSILANQITNIKQNFRDEIFNKIISNNELFNFDKIETFNLYKKLIFGINISNDNFFMFNKNDFRVNITDLNLIIGYNKLWEILMTNQNIDIQNECSDILCKICLGYKFPKKKEAENYVNSFIKTLNDNLNKIIEIDKESNEFSIKSILILVKKIFESIKSGGLIIEKSSDVPNINTQNNKDNNNNNNNNNNPVILVLNCLGIKKKFFCFNNFPFYLIRFNVSNEFNIPVNNIKFEYETIENRKKIIREFDMTDDFDLFNETVFKGEKINYEKYYYIKITNYHNPLIDLENNPQKILTNNEGFQKILTDLIRDKNKSYLNEVWNLIKEKIEKNEHIKNEIRKIVNEYKEEFDKEINLIFDFENTSVYYISYIISNINEILNIEKNNNNMKFIEDFINSKIYKEKLYNLIKNFSINEYINSDRSFLEKLETIKILNNITNICEILSLIGNEEVNTLIINKIIFFIKEIFEGCIEENSLNPNLYNKQIETMEKIINLINSKNLLMHFIIKILNDANIRNDFFFILNEGLIKFKNKEIKKKFKDFILGIFNEKMFIKEEEKKYFQDLNLFMFNYFLNDKNLETIINLSNDSSEYEFDLYFQIINKVIETILNLKLDFDFEKLIEEKFINPIINNTLSQEIISGYFLIIYTIITKLNITIDKINNEQFDFAKFIFEECLFNRCLGDPLKHNSPKITSKKGFKYASNLFNYLIIKNNEKVNYYYNKLNDFHYCTFWRNSNDKDIDNWNINTKNTVKQKYVGLKNLGCICYLNSLLQIFFHIIPFRESILNSYCNNEVKNVLYQTKYLFTSLKYLDIEYFEPKDFTDNFDNQKLNIKEQMDMDEFFSLFLDKLENRLKGTDNEDLIKYFFEIKTSDNLNFFNGCNHHRKKEVSLLSVQLQVKGKSNLKESLDSFVEGELMDNENCIFCEQCNKKFPAVKSQSFKKLPRILIFVLKRFEFDAHTMERIKINDQYEFPLELDMTDYLYENRQNIQYNFEKMRNLNNVNNNNANNGNNINNNNANNGNNVSNNNANNGNNVNNNNDNNDNNPNNDNNNNNNFQLLGNDNNNDNNDNNNNEQKIENINAQNTENINNQNVEKMENINDINKQENLQNENKTTDIEIDQNSLSQNPKTQNEKEKENETENENEKKTEKPTSNKNNINNENNTSKKNNKYKLKSVAIHSGNSEGGHYYAFIRVGKKNDNNWYQFNDTQITKFNINDLPKEAFGGYDTYEDPETKKITTFPSTRNAYLLFYEKENDDNCEKYDKINLVENENNNNKNNNIMFNSNFNEKINERMYKYNLQRILFSKEYHKFILEFLINNFNQLYNENEFEKLINFSCRTKINDDIIILENKNRFFGSCIGKYIQKGKINIFQNNKKLNLSKENINNKFNEYFQFLILYFFNVFIRAKVKSCYGGTIELIKFCLNNNEDCAKFLIEEFTNINILIEFIINCPIGEIKKIIVGLLYCAMLNTDKFYKNKVSNLLKDNKNIENKKINDNDKKNKNKRIDDDDYENLIILYEKESENKNYIIENNKKKEIYEFSPLLSNFIKNILKLIESMNINRNASNYLFYIIYRFSLISESTRDYLVKRIRLLSFLNYFYFSKGKNPFQTTWEYYNSEHSLLSDLQNETVHYELQSYSQLSNYYVILLIYQLNICQIKFNEFKKYCSENSSFKNLNYIKILINHINCKQDANVLSNLLCKVCFGNKEFTSNVNEVIKDFLNENTITNYNYFFLMLKNYLFNTKDNDNFKDFRINSILKCLFRIIENSYNNDFSIIKEIGNFVINLFLNHNIIMNKYLDYYIDNLKNLLKFYNQNENYFKDKIQIIQNLINSKILIL